MIVIVIRTDVIVRTAMGEFESMGVLFRLLVRKICGASCSPMDPLFFEKTAYGVRRWC
jgi:hypothetical protein